MQSNIPENIVIGGKEFPVNQFSGKVKQLVALYANWKNDLTKAQLDILKTETAIKSVEAELAQLVTAELQESKSDTNESETAVEAA